MRLKTANKRSNRKIWKACGHTHLMFNRGNYSWFPMVHEGVSYGQIHIPFERLQPNAYTKYTHT